MNLDPETLLQELSRSNILVRNHENELSLSDEFNQEVVNRREELAQSEADKIPDSATDILHERDAERLLNLSFVFQNLVALNETLQEHLPSLDSGDRLTVLIILDQLQRGMPQIQGAPDNFLPVRGDQLEVLLTVYDRAIVFVWREDCDPCETVRNDLEMLLSDKPDELGLYAVYGPGWEELLYNEYDAYGAPTTLFMLEGQVDARLQGAQVQNVLESEIATLRTRTI